MLSAFFYTRPVFLKSIFVFHAFRYAESIPKGLRDCCWYGLISTLDKYNDQNENPPSGAESALLKSSWSFVWAGTKRGSSTSYL